MRTVNLIPWCTATLSLTLLSLAPAWADSSCTAADYAQADRQAQQAEALERGGKAAEALEAMQAVRQHECLQTAAMQRVKAAWARATRTLGEQAEKAGRFDQANAFYVRGEHMADADRAMRKFAQANKSKASPLGKALLYFEQRQDTAAQAEVRALALASAEQLLQAEEKTFAAGRASSVPELQQAREFLRLTGAAGEKRANDRALQRGDALAKGNTPRLLEWAIDHYGFADARDKSESIKPIARRHGDAAAARGEHRIAEQFYALSGDDAKIEAMEKSREKAEGMRQKDFKKGADDLEKELKM